MFEFFVHLIKHVAKEITSVLLLVIRVIIPQKRLEDVFRINCTSGKETCRVKLISLIKVLADVHQLFE